MVRYKRSRAAAAVESGQIDDAYTLLAQRPDVLSFAVGAPDPRVLPTELVTALAHVAVEKYGKATLQYGMTQGFAPMLSQAQLLLCSRGIECAADTLHIGTGGSGALHTVCMALLDPGDVVLVETPTYAPALKVFRAHGAEVVAVESDEFGFVPRALDRALESVAAAFVYMLPTFQNPTGRTMPSSRRVEVAEVIRRHDALAIEDDVYFDLRYTGEPEPPLWSFAPDNVVYLTSVSKTLAPAMRVGIAAMPPALVADVLALKQGVDMQTSTFTQAIAAEFLAGPAAATHLRYVVETYAGKLDTLDNALDKHLPLGFTWTKPDGGMFVWVVGPSGFDADAMLPGALQCGVAYLPGSGFYAQHPRNHRNTMRLSIAGVPTDLIDSGISILGALCRRAIQ